MTDQHDPEQQPRSGGQQPPEEADVQSREDEELTPEDFDEDPSLNPDEEVLKDIKGG